MKKVLSMLKPHTGFLILSIVFSTVNTLLQLLIPLYTKDILAEGILEYNMEKLVELCLALLGFTLLSIVTSIANTYFSTKTSVGYAITMRNYIFDKVSRLSHSDIDKIGVASLVTRTTNDVRQVHDIVLNTLKSLVPIPIMLVGGLVLAFSLNPELAKLSLWAIPVLAVLAVVLISIIMPLYSKVQKLVDKMNQIMREKISGIRVIRAFNKSEYEDDRFMKANLELTGLSLKASRIMAGFLPILTLLMYTLICVIIYLCVMAANDLDIVTQEEEILHTIPNMYAFISYFTLIIGALTSVVSIVVSIPRASISGKRIKVIMDAVSDILPPENPVTPKKEDAGKLEFSNVSFKYKPVIKEEKKKRFVPKSKKKKPAEPQIPFELKNVSFESRPGETTAIIGITGSGKTTLCNLIPRLYDVTEGEVKLAGVNVKDLDPAEIGERIAFIPQQAFLFSGTIADNIRFGKKDATDAEIWHALEIAQAKSFVASMPDGIDSFVSQAGKNYSGGQKQRLAIARAIVKGAEVIVFDDSFSALDLATDARLRASLRENLSDANIIIVAQRVGTVLNADRIIVLDGGNVVGQGTHKELLKTCETYREIVATQLSEEALKEVDDDE
ncbi:MAG: ABC transporter ATP-binding protein [Ruminococcaceae bacterium]|nr:ABC transporter ATP-binding protein [Oscillospiraceae bacterium]